MPLVYVKRLHMASAKGERHVGRVYWKASVSFYRVVSVTL